MPDRVSGDPVRVDGPVGENGRKGRSPAPPILSVSVGTAGASRNWRFLQRMTDAGRLDRICSSIICDYNDGTVKRMKSRIKKTGGGQSSRVVLPEMRSPADGFLLNPYEFGRHLGDVDDDLKGLVEQAYRQSRNKGSQPQLILEFLGFGGHAIVGLMLHQKLRERFPGARSLPVVALPADEMLHDWMRSQVQDPPPETTFPDRMLGGTWKAYENYLDLGPYGCALVVDNRVDAAPNDDLALGLAVIEAAGTDLMKRGSLPEALGGIRLGGKGWIGMNVVRRVVPSRKSLTWGFPLRRLRPVWSNSNSDLAVQTRQAIKDCLTEGSLLERRGKTESEDPLAAMSGNSNGNYPPGANGNGSYQQGVNGNGNYHHPAAVRQPRVYVTIPVPNNTVGEVERKVRSHLDAEGFFERNEGINISFGSANFPERPAPDEEDTKGNILREIFGVVGWPFKMLGKMIIWPFVGGNERHQKEMIVVAVSLRPISGRISRVDEILHRRVQYPNGDETYSGFGTRVHSKPPKEHAREEAPEPAEGYASEEAPEPTAGYTSEEDQDPAEETVGNNAPSS